MARLELDRPSIRPSDEFSAREILRSIRSPHVILSLVLLFMVGAALSGLALFLPSIVSELGFSRNQAQLLTAGPFGAGFFGAFVRWTHRQKPIIYPLFSTIVILISAYLSDHYQSRGIATAFIATVAVVGYSMYLGNEYSATLQNLSRST